MKQDDEWQGKEVIDLGSGRRLGCVCGAEREAEGERLLFLLVSGQEGITRRPWTCIRHVGERLIVVMIKNPVLRG